jgi:dTDP-4-dehydrorhamnose 3,5-epimerase
MGKKKGSMNRISLESISTTTLKIVPTAGGDIMHALQSTEPEFAGFGEAYFSWVQKGVVKAWKLHQCMTLNLVVPLGLIRFVCFNLESKPNFSVHDIGTGNYVRLTVPPGIWFGFKGLAAPNNLLMNIASIPHDPSEVERRPLSDIDYNW